MTLGKPLYVCLGLLGDRTHQVNIIGSKDGVVKGINHCYGEAFSCSFGSPRRQSFSVNMIGLLGR